jgi:hypothetical protein
MNIRTIFKGDFDLTTPVGEALPGVQTKVENDLVHLGGIGIDHRAIRINLCLYFHPVRNDGAQDLEAFVDDLLKADGFKLRGRALAESAKLMDKIAGVVAGFEDLLECLAAGVALGHVHGHEFGAAENTGDQIVEFMGHATGELVEGVESLGLEQPEFFFRAQWLAPGMVGGVGLRFPSGFPNLWRSLWFHQNIEWSCGSDFDGNGRFCPPRSRQNFFRACLEIGSITPNFQTGPQKNLK